MTRRSDSPPLTGSAGARSDVVVRRSRKRRRSVQAYRDADTIVVLVPASLSQAEEDSWVTEMVGRIERSEARRRRVGSSGDAELMARGRRLAAEYLGSRAAPTSIRWVGNQNARWGSCTPSTGTIRLSDRLRPMPGWVIDYVLLHELAHLIEAGHGPRFWALLESYPRTQKAQGYLEGVHATAGLTGRWAADPDEHADPEGPGGAADGCTPPEPPA